MRLWVSPNRLTMLTATPQSLFRVLGYPITSQMKTKTLGRDAVGSRNGSCKPPSLVRRPNSTTNTYESLQTPPDSAGSEIREKFLRFFEKRGHCRLPSASLIPDDPTVLITIAGMLPFKAIFLGQSPVEYPRVTTTQKCVRTNDIENVGQTARHHTFFEMLGNFSFGDYFKKEAIKWAWELSTEEYGLPASHIWVSVFEEDDEAFALWQTYLPKERIIRMGKEDNFWAAGPTGPCGPCSELYYDFHPERGSLGEVDLNDDTRFIEFYNLVFMEKNRASDGTLSELQNKNIDTGMGLERMAQILQRVPNNYETDLIFPLVQKAAELASRDYYQCSEDEKRDLKVMADHMRAVTYLISDGVVPSNLGRGYILRRLIRRIVMKGCLLGIKASFTRPLCQVAIALSEGCDPNVKKQEDRILSLLSQEEEQFNRTLFSGQKKLTEFIIEANKQNTDITGKQAFMLFDTYGFPLEITEEISKTHNIKVDVAGFHEEMALQKQRSKSARQEVDLLSKNGDIQEALNNLPETEFLGYETLTAEGIVLALIQNGSFVEEINSVSDSPIEFEMILDKSPFYAESGGQVADQGSIYKSSDRSVSQLKILDVQSHQSGDLCVHKASLLSGSIRVQEKVTSEVDSVLRQKIKCHHTATHLLQSAIKRVLGDEVSQQGSLVSDDRLRFDFNFSKGLDQNQVTQIEQLVNQWIIESRPLTTQIMELEDAKAAGAIAMFGEKYSQQVRVVDVTGVSKELCGGTHVSNSSELLAFKVISESAIQSGIRRIEAVSGPAAVERFFLLSDLFNELRSTLKVDLENVASRVQELQKEVIVKSQENEALQKDVAMLKAESLLLNVEKVEKTSLVIGQLKGVDGKSVQSAVSHLLAKMDDPAAVVLGVPMDDRVSFAVGFSPSLVKGKLNAGKFVSKVAEICDGRGGGRPNLAQAGGRNTEKLQEALKFAQTELTEKVKNL